MRLAPSLHRLGEAIVSCYLLEEAGEVTIIDAGVPAYYADLNTELAAMGRTIEDVRALVLTHGHDDHIGFAERLRLERDVPVSVHELDAALARGEVGNPSAGMGERRLRSLLHYMLWLMRRGAMRTKALTEVGTFDPGTTLDVPGALRVIHTPGHTHGSVPFHAPAHDALFVGDALATDAVITGRHGPQVCPFAADPDEALASLASIEEVQAHWLLPGHGEPWTDGVAAAVAAAREVGVGHLARPKQ
ncbi:MAG: MBL fold metallo-hydrolase [Chloroflexota bacterium]|nr:MBL fold metallo-hydrolase [Chloroflexota bacterium]